MSLRRWSAIYCLCLLLHSLPLYFYVLSREQNECYSLRHQLDTSWHDRYAIFVELHMKVKVLVNYSCPTLCNTMDSSLASSSVHGILQARIMEWVAIPFSRGSSQPRNWTQVSCIAGRFFTIWATWESLNYTHTHTYIYTHTYIHIFLLETHKKSLIRKEGKYGITCFHRDTQRSEAHYGTVFKHYHTKEGRSYV